MRLVQVVHWFLPGHRAGTEIYAAQLASALAQRHTVSVYCREEGHPEARFYEEEDEYQGLPVHRVYANVPPGRGYLARKALARFRNRRIEASFAAYLARVQPDLVHIHHLFKLSGGLIQVAREMGIPTVVTLHDYWFLCYSGQLLLPDRSVCVGPRGGWPCPGCAEVPLSPARRRLVDPLLLPLFFYRTAFLRQALHQADAIIAPSRHLREVFLRQGFAPERILFCDNGTDLSWQVQASTSQQGTLHLGYIGTIAPHKGLHVLLEALQGWQGPPVELRVYGEGQRTRPMARRYARWPRARRCGGWGPLSGTRSGGCSAR